jgi:superfamily I DNA/RNA helicase
LIELNPSQKLAVGYHDGPLLIVAGPGSGKTRVIIERIIHMVNSGIKPEEILCLTFTKKATEEIIEYQKDKNPEELADILEVIYRIAKLRGISKEELEEIRIKKVEKRGGFDKNLFLIDASDD